MAFGQMAFGEMTWNLYRKLAFSLSDDLLRLQILLIACKAQLPEAIIGRECSSNKLLSREFGSLNLTWENFSLNVISTKLLATDVGSLSAATIFADGIHFRDSE